ncbi:MAG: 4,5-dihydroxyphthalate decarboxylase [Rhodoferax sp.]|nr:4,5-dihydroxyphthalate decarboxylase [Rhodoferax sp.]
MSGAGMENATTTTTATPKTLSFACGVYDRTWPLAASVASVPGYELAWKHLPTEEIFLRGMLGGEFEIAEMSMSSYLLQCARGDNLYQAIPAFVSRKFRHGSIYVRADAGINTPEDLRGRKIGVPEYQLTANVWARGLLSDEYGVRSNEIHWVIGGVEEPGRDEKIPVQLPESFQSTRLEPGETLWGMMTAARLDAIIAPRAPRAFVEGDTRIRRLFADPVAAEKAYYKKTRLFPLMHVVGIRKDVIADDPALAAGLLTALEAGRRHALNRLHQSNVDTTMLPWLEAHVRETEEVMGRDYWPYGTEANRHAIETLCRYALEQGVITKHMTVEDLFPLRLS